MGAKNPWDRLRQGCGESRRSARRAEAEQCAVVGSLLLLVAGACGSSTPSPSPNPSNPYTITISTSGVASPKTLTVPPGTRVLFINSHSRRHDITSDPHPDHLDCPELNQVGLLNPGQSRESGNLVAVRTCGFHDHEDPDNVNLRGSITVR